MTSSNFKFRQTGRYSCNAREKKRSDYAACVALSSNKNLTTVFWVAYFNKGNALKNFGLIGEAKSAYAKAQELDKSLLPPDMSSVPIPPSPTALLFLEFTVQVAVT